MSGSTFANLNASNGSEATGIFFRLRNTTTAAIAAIRRPMDKPAANIPIPTPTELSSSPISFDSGAGGNTESPVVDSMLIALTVDPNADAVVEVVASGVVGGLGVGATPWFVKVRGATMAVTEGVGKLGSTVVNTKGISVGRFPALLTRSSAGTLSVATTS